MEFPTEVGSVDIYWLGHATVKLQDSDGFTVYVDPWSDVMREDLEDDGDVIISTHDHFDHFDVKAIQAVKRQRGTVVVCTEESREDVPEDLKAKVIQPNRTVEAHDLKIHGVPAYNVDKYRNPDEPFHPEGFCTGVVFDLEGITFYHASDTDPIDEMEELADRDIDVAFMPVGGTYTMDQDEAIEAIKKVQPGKVVPIHYGFVDGTSADVERFEEDVREKTDAEPMVLEPQTPL